MASPTTHHRPQPFWGRLATSIYGKRSYLLFTERTVRDYYYSIAPATENIIDRKKNISQSGAFILCWTNYMSAFRNVAALWDRWNSKNRFCSLFTDNDSRQHWFDPTSTKLPAVPRGPDSALEWQQRTPSITVTPMCGLRAHAGAILLSVKQCPWNKVTTIMKAIGDCVHRGGVSLPLSVLHVLSLSPQLFNASQLSWEWTCWVKLLQKMKFGYLG